MPTRFDFIPIGLFGKAMEVTDMVRFLTSEPSNYIKGAVLSTDGGRFAESFAQAVYKPILKMEEG
jgi:NAD(P)-dependent dehydrogenase (short-subunit alcohol dehydrogenase family)